MQKNYLDKVYAGFLGMNAGIRLGAPVEPTLWTYDRIYKTYGDITNYVKEFKNFAADDDANGPVFFLRALYDDARDRELVPQDVAKAWLNYSRDGKGMFWWGGYGVSTEHTAFENIKMGVEAPASGSIEQNGIVMAEQIGGQIFIDTWGLLFPNNPEKAAQYGRYAASVSHDGEGIHGAEFFCACIAKAFESDDIREIVECGLSQLPEESTYNKVSRAVIEFYEKNPDDFRACRQMLEDEWGYDRYPGTCHIIPNAGVCILSMMYGKGDFNRTIEIATMCGWDTDCNAGNVGTVLGVMVGIEGIGTHYLEPINDFIVLSSIAGSLNILDIPTYAKELALLGYRVNGQEAPKELVESYREGEIYFDFTLPNSTHGFRVSDPFFCRATHSDEMGYKTKGSLKVVVDRMFRGDRSKVYYKPYYVREDFSDERYSPVFSPQVYSGQKVSLKIFLDQPEGTEMLGVAPFVHLANQDKDIELGFTQLKHGEWHEMTFELPDSEGDLIDEVGVILEGYAKDRFRTVADVYIDEFEINGGYDYEIDFAKQKVNFGCVSPFSHNYGAWGLMDNKLHVMSSGYAESYAGAYFAKDYEVETTIIPITGESHLLAIRSQGAKRGYFAGFAKDNRICIYKNDWTVSELVGADFVLEKNREYKVKLTAQGNVISLFIDDKMVLQTEDDTFAYGMYGCARFDMGRCLYGNFKVRGN